MTSGFFVLMVSPKASQADENVSMFRCISSSELAFRAQSSANRKSRALLLFGSDLQSPQIKQFAISAAADGHGVCVVVECSFWHGRENHTEECGSQHATLSDAICDLDGF